MKYHIHSRFIYSHFESSLLRINTNQLFLFCFIIKIINQKKSIWLASVCDFYVYCKNSSRYLSTLDLTGDCIYSTRKWIVFIQGIRISISDVSVSVCELFVLIVSNNADYTTPHPKIHWRKIKDFNPLIRIEWFLFFVYD